MRPDLPNIETFVLDSESTTVTKKRLSKQRKLQKELNKKAREESKEQERQREQRKNSKPILIQVVTHQPTYSFLSLRRHDGEPQHRKPSCTFSTKNEVQSTESQSRLKNAINWMILFADMKPLRNKGDNEIYWNKLGFMTLTIPDLQKHTDNFIKKHMLQPFLLSMQRKLNCSYVWKAEPQINGNIHFHVTIDKFFPWQGVQEKWNKLCARFDYCTVFPNGTNDKGNASTSIKAVKNDNKAAKDIGGYMSKKDLLPKEIEKSFEAILNGEKKNTPVIQAGAKIIMHKKAFSKHDAYKIVEHNFKTANVHCKFNTDHIILDHDSNKYLVVKEAKQDYKWYKRVIEGRLWGCSANLSKLKIEITEEDEYFEKEEKIFFQQNKADIYNLGRKIITREKQRHADKDEATRQVLNCTDEAIEQKNRFLNYVYVHPILSKMKKGGMMQTLLHEKKLTAAFKNQLFIKEN